MLDFDSVPEVVIKGSVFPSRLVVGFQVPFLGSSVFVCVVLGSG